MKRTFIICLQWAALLILILTGCNAEKQASQYYNNHPDKDAERCAAHFPYQVNQGSITIDSSHLADNKNYQGAIDSLQGQVDRLNTSRDVLLDQLAAQKNWDTVAACRAVITKYQQDVASLQKQVKSLRDSYKPCIPDTVWKTRIDTLVGGPQMFLLQKTVADLTVDRDKKTKQVKLWKILAAVPTGILILIILALAFRYISYMRPLK